ncbi:MAG: hypothetical protein ACPHCN_09380 [Mycobacterium sp.]
MADTRISVTSRVAHALLGKIGGWLNRDILTELALVDRLNSIVALQEIQEAEEVVYSRMVGPADNATLWVDNNSSEGVPVGRDDVFGGWGLSEDMPFATLAYAELVKGMDGSRRQVNIAVSATPYIAPARMTGGWYDRYRPKSNPLNGTVGYDSKTWTIGAGSSDVEGWSCTDIVDEDGNPAAWTANEHIGRFIDGVAGDASGKRFMVKSNGVDTLELVSTNDLTQPTNADISGSTIRIFDYDDSFTIELVADTIMDSIGAWWCRFSGSYELTILGDAQYLFCDFALDSVYMPEEGELKYCYVRCEGQAPGHLTITGRARLYSVIIDGSRASGGDAYDGFFINGGDVQMMGGFLILQNMVHPLRCIGHLHGNPVVSDFPAYLMVDSCEEPLVFNPRGYGVGGGMRGLTLLNSINGTNGITGQAEIIEAWGSAKVDIPAASTLTGSTSVDAVNINGSLVASASPAQDAFGTIVTGSTENPATGYTTA